MSEKKRNMGKISLLTTVMALLLTMLLFVCVVVLSSTTTRTFAAYTIQTTTPTIIVTATPTTIVTATPESSPSPTLAPSPSPTMAPSPTPQPSPTPRPSPTATPSPTPQPSPTVAPSPTPVTTPIPTATSVPTAVPSPTVVIKPTIAVTPTVVHPTPVVTKKAEPLPMSTATQIPTVVSLKPTSDPVEITDKHKATVVTPDAFHTGSPVVPLVVGTLLTLCLGAVGFVGARRVRTALLPAIDLKKQKAHTFAQSWQRVRTTSSPVPPIYMQETFPFSSVPEPQQQSIGRLLHVEVSPSVLTDEGPTTGPHRRLGPVRLRKMAAEPPFVPETPVAAPMLPIDIEDMSFLDDPMLQDTLRHYRQKGQKG